jgi:hypothetical protein
MPASATVVYTHIVALGNVTPGFDDANRKGSRSWSTCNITAWNTVGQLLRAAGVQLVRVRHSSVKQRTFVVVENSTSSTRDAQVRTPAPKGTRTCDSTSK